MSEALGEASIFLLDITVRFRFERAFYERRARGELSVAEIEDLMRSTQREVFGDALADGGEDPLFWASKMHFFITSVSFYNFPYTFGYLLSLGVYALADEFGDSFPQKYRDLLIATGCKNAEEAVQSTFGYDLTQPDFWNKSLDIVQSRVQQYLELKDAVG